MSEGSRHMQSIHSIDLQPSSLPAVKIEQPGGSDQLLIRVLTPKRSTDLTSKLFEVLVEESLDVLHSHKSSSKEKILHSIRVKVRHITADSFLLRLVILICSSHSKSIKHSLGLVTFNFIGKMFIGDFCHSIYACKSIASFIIIFCC